ncbi:MAG: TrkA C-terminal domain-containing protein [Marmoricola sp.]
MILRLGPDDTVRIWRRCWPPPSTGTTEPASGPRPAAGLAATSPENCSLVTILRDGQVYTPDPDQPVESGDELLLVVPAEIEEELEKMLAPTEHGDH